MKSIPKFSREFIDKVEKRGIPDKLKKMLILPVIVFVAVLFASGDYGLVKYFRLRNKIETAEKDIEMLKLQAVDYNWEIKKLKYDTEYQGLYAAEFYGYAKADQTVIQFLPVPDTLQ